MIEVLTYTLTGILLYLLSDWLLQRMEIRAGRRFEHRSIVFFFIIAFLAVTSFAVFRYFIANQ